MYCLPPKQEKFDNKGNSITVIEDTSHQHHQQQYHHHYFGMMAVAVTVHQYSVAENVKRLLEDKKKKNLIRKKNTLASVEELGVQRWLIFGRGAE
uniref:Uncharacterized protein n=1 Tax=Glossina pallidipes TaxID=7398 RepID=A0A1A9ZBJ7_GLOPL